MYIRMFLLCPTCYSLSLLPHGGPDDFASCGEDGSLRVWKGIHVYKLTSYPFAPHCSLYIALYIIPLDY